MSKRETTKTPGNYILLTLTVLTAVFIFFRSLQPAAESAEESGVMLGFINNIISSLGIDRIFDMNIIRKAAHYTEFMAFSVFLTITLYKFFRDIAKYIFIDLFFCIFIPLCDEGLQYFSVGRSPEVKDVFLDFVGALTGVLVVLLIIFIKNRVKVKNEAK